MENCLVTKLKATVNNPNLPYLETMQQFTLDAIAASGNNSITDSQKWALNHFFYQIGAITNSGIYSKLAALYMPMICGDNLDKAMVDYKGGSTLSLTGKKVAFQSHGLVEGATGSGNNVQTSYADGVVNNLSVAVIYMGHFDGVSSRAFGFRKLTTDTMRIISAAKATSSIYAEIFGLRVVKANEQLFDGMIASLNGETYSAVFVSESPFANDSVSQTPELPNGLDITYLYFTTQPVGIYAYGSALTEQESFAFANAAYELREAFIS